MTPRTGEPRRAAGSHCNEPNDGATSTRAADDHAPAALSEVMGQLARVIQQEHGDVEKTLRAITSGARDSVPGADSVSVSFVTGREARSRAATDDLPLRVDELQSRLDEGPCLDALREQTTVRVDDVALETRWPGFAAEAAKVGMGSSLSFQLFVEGDTLGALNIYARSPHAFDQDSETIGFVFASHASIALAAARQEEHLRRAVDTRDLIGQAKGILMERHLLTAPQAFQVLVRASSHTNRKLFDLAEELTTTGVLPED